MPTPPTIAAIGLFVDDLSAARRFYREVFAVQPLFEDEETVALQFENVLVTLKQHEPGVPGSTATTASAPCCQLSLWVQDVDAVCAELRRHGLRALQGPTDTPDGLRVVGFVDPSGHRWELTQRLASSPRRRALSVPA